MKLLLVLALFPLLSACSPDGLYSFNVGSLSAGVIVNGCRVQAGYYDAGTGRNDSGEWDVCR